MSKKLQNLPALVLSLLFAASCAQGQQRTEKTDVLDYKKTSPFHLDVPKLHGKIQRDVLKNPSIQNYIQQQRQKFEVLLITPDMRQRVIAAIRDPSFLEDHLSHSKDAIIQGNFSPEVSAAVADVVYEIYPEIYKNILHLAFQNNWGDPTKKGRSTWFYKNLHAARNFMVSAFILGSNTSVHVLESEKITWNGPLTDQTWPLRKVLVSSNIADTDTEKLSVALLSVLGSIIKDPYLDAHVKNIRAPINVLSFHNFATLHELEHIAGTADLENYFATLINQKDPRISPLDSKRAAEIEADIAAICALKDTGTDPDIFNYIAALRIGNCAYDFFRNPAYPVAYDPDKETREQYEQKLNNCAQSYIHHTGFFLLDYLETGKIPDYLSMKKAEADFFTQTLQFRRQQFQTHISASNLNPDGDWPMCMDTRVIEKRLLFIMADTSRASNCMMDCVQKALANDSAIYTPEARRIAEYYLVAMRRLGVVPRDFMQDLYTHMEDYAAEIGDRLPFAPSWPEP